MNEKKKKLTSEEKTKTLATKAELKVELDKITKFQTFEVIFAVKAILKMMQFKIIYCFKNSIDILKGLVIANVC